MNTYPKIQGLYKRYMFLDKKNINYGKFIIGEYSKPEFELLKDIEWVWTEKIDGTNIRVQFWNEDTSIIKFKGKTDKADIPLHLLKKLEQLFSLEKMKKIFGVGEVCLYGEGYGYKIQSGGKYFINPNDVGFILFDIKIGKWWIKREDLEKIADQLGIDIVPKIGIGTIDEAIAYVKKGFNSRLGQKDFLAEGLVIRPKYELLDRSGKRIITKIKVRDFKEKQ